MSWRSRNVIFFLIEPNNVSCKARTFHFGLEPGGSWTCLPFMVSRWHREAFFPLLTVTCPTSVTHFLGRLVLLPHYYCNFYQLCCCNYDLFLLYVRQHKPESTISINLAVSRPPVCVRMLGNGGRRGQRIRKELEWTGDSCCLVEGSKETEKKNQVKNGKRLEKKGKSSPAGEEKRLSCKPLLGRVIWPHTSPVEVEYLHYVMHK